MKQIFPALAMTAFLLVGCAIAHPERSSIEAGTDLGHGFRRVTLAEPTVSSFQSIGHFEYLYYRNQRLCRWGRLSLAPDGQYAIYQDGSSGKLFLFRTADQKITPMTNQFSSFPDSLQWHETPGTVQLHITTGGETNQVEIP